MTTSPEGRQTVGKPGSKTRSCSSEIGEERTANDQVLKLKQPKRHWRIPFIGVFIDRHLFNIENPTLARRYGSVYTTDFLGRKLYMITSHPGVVRAFRDTAVFKASGALPSNFDRLLGSEVILTVDGSIHATRRRELLPAMAAALFPVYYDTVVQSAQQLWDGISKQTAKNPIQIGDFIRQHYLRVIVSISTGLSVEDHDNGNSQSKPFSISEKTFLDFVKGFVTLPFGPMWTRALDAKMEVQKLLRRTILYRLRNDCQSINELREMSVIQGQPLYKLKRTNVDFLTLLIASSTLKTGKFERTTPEDEPDIQRICHDILLLWFAGYSTQSAGTLSCVSELGKNRDAWEQLVREQGSLKTLSYETVSRLPLLQSFILEVLRMRPPVAMWYRKTWRSLSIDNIGIPSEAIVGLDIWAAQRDCRIFQNPDQFQIDRFLQTKPDALPPSSVIAFGAAGGAHYCLGAQLAKLCMSVTLATLLRSYDLDVVKPPSDIYRPTPELIPRDGVTVRSCTKRNNLSHQ